MKFKTILVLALCTISSIYIISGCATQNDAKGEVVISGEVVNASSGSFVENAIVEITSPASLRQTTTSDSLGVFSFTVQVDSSINITVEASKQGFDPAVNSFKITGGVDETGLSLQLRSQSSGGGDGGGDQVGGEPEGPAAIILTNASNQAINIAETGDVVSAAFTFQVQDSAGRSLNLEKAVDVEFNILSGPGGGETVIPATARTNAQGSVTTSIFSGNAAGPVKLQAIVDRPELGLTIRSNPVLLAIHGGFPDPNHFSIAPSTSNFEGYNINNVRDQITVIVGDQFSNPVKPGTVVYFSTTGGVIQGSGQTDADGIVTVALISGDPRPNDAVAGSGGRPGYATVTARTVDENNSQITKQTTILFSGLPQNPVVSPTTFAIPPNGGESFTYTATDINGNPLPPGTQFAVEVGEGLDATGDADFVLGDFLFPGPGSTEFSFSVTDTDEMASDVGGTTITVRVTTPGGKQASTSITGTRAKSAGN